MTALTIPKTESDQMIRAVGWVCLLYLLAFGSVSADSAAPVNTGQPAYYLVFKLDQQGTPELVFQRSLRLAALPQGQSPHEFEAAENRRLSGSDLVSARVLARDGRILFQKVIDMSHDIRAEFVGNDGKQIERHHVRSVDRSFVLRIPAFPDGTLALSNGFVSEFSIPEIAIETARIQALESSASAVSSAVANAPANRVDFLIMGDGYTTAETALFDSHVANFNSRFFSISPYTEYQDFVNTTPLFTASTESGSDHPPFDADCVWTDKSCCADINAQTDPKAGTFVATAFDSTFCSSNLHRLIYANSAESPQCQHDCHIG